MVPSIFAPKSCGLDLDFKAREGMNCWNTF